MGAFPVKLACVAIGVCTSLGNVGLYGPSKVSLWPHPAMLPFTIDMSYSAYLAHMLILVLALVG